MNVIGIVGWKNCGKTTLATSIIRELSSRGFTVNSVKHAHHGVDVDQLGTDSYYHRDAGAQEVILAGGKRFAIMHELRDQPEPELDDLLTRLGPCDWVVVEGFKQHRYAKIEAHRGVCNERPLYKHDPTIIGVASDVALDFDGPCFDLNDCSAIVEFIVSRGVHETLTQ